jgi:hypothetical protein
MTKKTEKKMKEAAQISKPGGDWELVERDVPDTDENAKAISALVEGLAPNGKLLIPAGPDEPLTIKVAPMTAG